MIALLPDVGLQRALLRAMRGEAAPRVPHVFTPARCRGNRPPVWAKGVVAALQVCSVCGQVCRSSRHTFTTFLLSNFSCLFLVLVDCLIVGVPALRHA